MAIHSPKVIPFSNSLTLAVRLFFLEHGISQTHAATLTNLSESTISRCVNQGQWGIGSLASFRRAFPDLAPAIDHYLSVDPSAVSNEGMINRRAATAR